MRYFALVFCLGCAARPPPVFGLDAGTSIVIDAGETTFDAGNGSERVCNFCQTDADCLVSQACKDRNRNSAFCRARLPGCAYVGAATHAVIDVRLANATCIEEIAQCTFRGEFDADAGTATVTMIEETLDGTIVTPLGALRDVDLPSLWRGVEESMCVTSTDFAEQRVCFTHAGMVQVSLQSGSQHTHFEYNGRGSPQPPAQLEAAIDRITLQMFDLGRDAGVIQW